MISLTLSNIDVEIILSLIIAFTQGGLLGLEREKARIEHHVSDAEIQELPGVRTFGLISLLGAITSIMVMGPIKLAYPANIVLFVSSIVFVLILTFKHMYYRLFKQGILGVTTYVVVILAYIIGLLTGLQYYIISLGLTFLIAGVLASKKVVLRAIEKLSYGELAAGLELGMIVFILGPIALNTNYQFYGVSIAGAYVFFTLILVISYTSYLLYKIKGSESIGLIGFLGGLVNSEATLVNVLRIAPRGLLIIKPTLLVNSGMLLRTGVLALVGAYPFLPRPVYIRFAEEIFIAVFLGYLAMILTYYFIGKKHVSGSFPDKEVIRSPLELKTAVRGALIYILLFITSKLVSDFLGNYALLGVAFIGGFASAGATVFSLLSLSSSVPPSLIASGTVLAASSAFLNKIIYARIVVSDRGSLKGVLIAIIPPAILLILYGLLLLYI